MQYKYSKVNIRITREPMHLVIYGHGSRAVAYVLAIQKYRPSTLRQFMLRYFQVNK